MAVTKLMQDSEAQFQSAFEKVAMGEDLAWDLQWVVINTDQGPKTVFHVYVHCAALFHIGAKLQHTFLAPIGAKDEDIDRLVRDEVNNMFAQRRQRLQQLGNGGTHDDEPPKRLQLPGM